MGGTGDIVWRMEICHVCEEPVSLSDKGLFVSIGDGLFVHHIEGSEERTCLELLFDGYARLWTGGHEEPYLVSGQSWIPEKSKASGGC